MLRRIMRISVLAVTMILSLENNAIAISDYNPQICVETADLPDITLHPVKINTEEQDEIRNEIMYGEVEELALLIFAEAGNQDELGKRYVADVVLNRVDSKDFPNTIHDVIFQLNPLQFSSITDGNYAKAEYYVTEDCFTIALEEYENRNNCDIIYFRTDHYSEYGKPAFVHGSHYFSTGG